MRMVKFLAKNKRLILAIFTNCKYNNFFYKSTSFLNNFKDRQPIQLIF